MLRIKKEQKTRIREIVEWYVKNTHCDIDTLLTALESNVIISEIVQQIDFLKGKEF